MKDFIIYQENLFETFLEIPPYDYKEKMQFYVEYREDLMKMDDPYFLRIRVDYLEALFFLGQYDRFLKEVRNDLIYVIRNNIKYFEGKDIFRWLLVLKGAALYNTEQYRASADIFKQLIRMFPTEVKLKWYLYRAMYQQQVRQARWLNLFYAVVLASIVAFSIAELFVGMKWPALLHEVTSVRNTLLLSGMAFFIVTMGYRVFKAAFDSWRLYQDK